MFDHSQKVSIAMGLGIEFQVTSRTTSRFACFIHCRYEYEKEIEIPCTVQSQEKIF